MAVAGKVAGLVMDWGCCCLELGFAKGWTAAFSAVVGAAVASRWSVGGGTKSGRA